MIQKDNRFSKFTLSELNNFSGKIRYFALDGTFVGGIIYKNGKRVGSLKFENLDLDPKLPGNTVKTRAYQEVCEQHLIEYETCYSSGGAMGGFESESEQECSYEYTYETVCEYVNVPDEPQPCGRCGSTSCLGDCKDPDDKESGGNAGDQGDGDKTTGNISEKTIEKINRLKEMSQCTKDHFENNDVNFGFDSSFGFKGGYNPVSNTITFNSPDPSNNAIYEEITHALQDCIYGGISNNGGLNVEFEAQIIRMLYSELITPGLGFGDSFSSDLNIWIMDFIDSNFSRDVWARFENNYNSYFEEFKSSSLGQIYIEQGKTAGRKSIDALKCAVDGGF